MELSQRLPKRAWLQSLYFWRLSVKSPSLHFSAPNLYFLQKPDNCLTLKDVEDFCKLHCLSVAFQLHLPLSQRARSRFITSNWIQDLETVLKMVNLIFIHSYFCFYYVVHKSTITFETDLYSSVKCWDPQRSRGLLLTTILCSNRQHHDMYPTPGAAPRHFPS